jgi:hypothetical protein
MKRILVAMITLLAATAANASDVGVSVSIGQPGFYLNIGNFPPPVVYAHPVVGRPAPVVVARPVYVHVPPGHVKHWQGYRNDHHDYYGHDRRYRH